MEALRQKYEAAGQSHVFKWFDEGKVGEGEMEAFLEQLRDIDVESLSSKFDAAMTDATTASSGESDTLQPLDNWSSMMDSSEDVKEKWKTLGMESIGRGEVAAVVLSGGQGTRLGFNGPKGEYDIGLPSGKSIFQLHSERILRLRQMTGGDLPQYVMTSPLNHERVMKFYEEHNYFGLGKDSVFFFTQGTLPCLTKEGKIILQSASVVASAPDGNGGVYPALKKSGALADMERRGVKSIFVYAIDNVIAKVADPAFIGFCVQAKADCGNKVVWKSSAAEKVGVLAKRNGRPGVVEYSEMDDASKQLTNQEGKLLFGAGNICVHFFSLDFLRDTVLPNMASQYHVAWKKIPYADGEGNTVTPSENNGIKLESFIFDVFPLARSFEVLEINREEEFAPVKNAPGSASDSPDTARAMISAEAVRWVTAAGGTVQGEGVCEISPLVSYGGEALEERVGGSVITLPYVLEEDSKSTNS